MYDAIMHWYMSTHTYQFRHGCVMFQAVLDFEVYIFNLTKANMPGNEPEWYKEYSAKVRVQIHRHTVF